jgi:hypothetical protein
MFDLQRLQAFNAQKEEIQKAFSPDMAAQFIAQLEREFSAEMSANMPAVEAPAVEAPVAQQTLVNMPSYQPVPAQYQSTPANQQVDEALMASGLRSGKTQGMVASWREAGRAVNGGNPVRHTL